MRLAVLSDIHGNLVALDAVLADLDALGGADTIWMLGDVAAFGPRPAECIRRLREVIDRYGEKNVHCISGNTDRYLVTGERPRTPPAEDAGGLQERQSEFPSRDLALNWALSRLAFEDYDFLRKLGSDLALEAPGYGWVIGYHGVPGDDEGYLKPDTAAEEARDALLDREGSLGIGGHIHVQMDRDLGSWRVVNVGSIGMSFQSPGVAQWGLFTFENGSLTVDLRNLPYDTGAVLNDLHAAGHPMPDWAAAKMRLASPGNHA